MSSDVLDWAKINQAMADAVWVRPHTDPELDPEQPLSDAQMREIQGAFATAEFREAARQLNDLLVSRFATAHVLFHQAGLGQRGQFYETLYAEVLWGANAALYFLKGEPFPTVHEWMARIEQRETTRKEED
jgi:hypothetical protein